jgi:hypothetical protein
MRTPHALFLLCVTATLAIVAPLHSGDRAGATKPKVSFTAVPVKARFHKNEKVIFRFTVRNESEEELRVSSAFILNYDIHLAISDNHQETVPWCGVVARYIFNGDRFVTLHPGKFLRVDREISCDASHSSGFSFPGPGEYSVNATYHFPVSPKRLREHPGPIPFASGSYRAELAHFKITDKVDTSR